MQEQEEQHRSKFEEHHITVSEEIPKSTAKKLVVVLSILVVVLSALVAWKWYGQIQEYKAARNDDAAHIAQLSKELEELKAAVEKGSASDEATGKTLEEDFFSIKLPIGFQKKSGDRLFVFTAEPAQHYSYLNETTGDYFEVNVLQEDRESGVSPDYTWTYTYTDGGVGFQKLTTTVCDTSDEMCSSAGDGRLDVYVGSKERVSIAGRTVYFTFGNTKSEEPQSMDFVDVIVGGLNFN